MPTIDAGEHDLATPTRPTDEARQLLGLASPATARRTFRAAAKRRVERLLVWGGAPRLLRALHRTEALVLAYHNIVPDDAPPAGDVPLHLPQSRFAEQLDAVRKMCDVVPLASLLEPPRRPPRRPRVAITFDDAYRGAVMLGGTELAKRDMPATVFVNPGFLGRSFWWDAVVWPDNSSWPTPFRDRALEALGGQDERVRRDAAEKGIPMREPPPTLRIATEDELHRALDAAPLTLGSHTWSHPNLPALAPSELDSELRRPLEWLREHFSRSEAIIAYPYGYFSDTVVDAVRASGYRAAVGAWGGWIRGVPRDPYRIPRLSIGRELSFDGFVLSIAGFPRP